MQYNHLKRFLGSLFFTIAISSFGQMDSIIYPGIDSNMIPLKVRNKLRDLKKYSNQTPIWNLGNSRINPERLKYCATFIIGDKVEICFDSLGIDYNEQYSSFLKLTPAAKSNFIAMYPDAKNVVWDENCHYDSTSTKLICYDFAQYKVSNKAYAVNFDTTGKFHHTEITLLDGKRSLPEQARKYIRNNLLGYKFKIAIIYTDKTNTPSYIMVRMDNRKDRYVLSVQFNMKGDLLGQPKKCQIHVIVDPSF